MTRHEDDTYIGFFESTDGTGAGLAGEIIAYMEKYEIDHAFLEILSWDGTSANTGYKGGAIFHFQRALKKPLQVSVCLLHQIELPMRKIFCDHEGTSGLGTFRGTLGKLLATKLWLLPVGSFKKIAVPYFPKILPHVLSKMNNDVQMLYHLSLAVISGSCPPDSKAARYVIAKLTTARWITFQSRCLRLYITGTVPQEHADFLEILVTYIVKVYAPGRHKIKLENDLVFGPKHLFEEIQRIRQVFSGRIREMLLQNVRYNAYFSHPHAIIVGMLGDPDYRVRKRAVEMEQRAREKAAAEPERRNYQHILPEMNMSATHYKDMLTIHEEEYTRDWYWPSGKYGTQVQEVRVRVTPVPLLRKYDDMQLIGFIHEGPLRTPYSCHNQACERAVKLTSDTCQHRADYESQLRCALMADKSRRDYPDMVRKRLFSEVE